LGNEAEVKTVEESTMVDTPDEPETSSEPTSQQDLEALFDAWDDRKVAEVDAEEAPEHVRRAWRYDPFRLWLSLTILLIAIAGSAMWATRHEVAYFMQRGTTPTDLGRLSERWRNGERELKVASNRYVTVSGMFTTFEGELAGEEGQEMPAEHIFLCPLFDIAVRATTPPPKKPYHKIASITVEEDFLPLLQSRRIFPIDLTAETGAIGRLVRGVEVPPWHAQVLKYFALQIGADPYDMWLLIEGERPQDMRRFAFIWLAAITTILIALGLFSRAWMKRRSGQRSTA
jgi:hypothetical protein